MILETVVAAACFAGTSEACNNGLQAYVKYYKIDDQVQQIGNGIRKQYPVIYAFGIVGGALVKKQYKAILYGPISGNIDFTDYNNTKYGLVYTYNF